MNVILIALYLLSRISFTRYIFLIFFIHPDAANEKLYNGKMNIFKSLNQYFSSILIPLLQFFSHFLILNLVFIHVSFKYKSILSKLLKKVSVTLPSTDIFYLYTFMVFWILYKAMLEATASITFYRLLFVKFSWTKKWIKEKDKWK